MGIGLGPTLIGYLNDIFTQSAFGAGDFVVQCPGGTAPAGASAAVVGACRAAAGTGIVHAIMAMSLLFAAAALFYFLASFNLRKDLDTHYEAPVEA